MKTLLVTSFPSFHDVVLLEPTLEALYYKHAPCKLVLRTWEGFFPFFEHHPLIHDLIAFVVGDTLQDCLDEKVKAIDLCGADLHVELEDLEFSSLLLPTVEKFAALAGVLLTRKTPWICLPDRPKVATISCRGIFLRFPAVSKYCNMRDI